MNFLIYTFYIHKDSLYIQYYYFFETKEFT
jgi:hypothetical protein